ncbi:putative ribonuclease H-like domain-containing protein [Tanacetum coccineum]
MNFSLHDDEELSLHDDASLAGSQPASNKGDAPAKPPQIITTNTLSNIKLPVLQKDDYDTWAMEMEHYLEYIDNERPRSIDEQDLEECQMSRYPPPQLADCYDCAITARSSTRRQVEGQEWMEKCMWHLIREKLSVQIATNTGQLLGSASLKDSFNALKAKYDELQSEFGDQEAALVGPLTSSSTKHMEHRGIFDSGCSGHMTGNRAHLEDYQELSKVGSVTFGGSKGSISGKDNGTEFKNRVMLEFCGKKGIKQEFSNARTPQQNGVAERKNRTLIEAARTMLAELTLAYHILAERKSILHANLQQSHQRVEVNLHVNFPRGKTQLAWIRNIGSTEVNDIDVQTEEAEELSCGSSTSRTAAGSEHHATKKSHSSRSHFYSNINTNPVNTGSSDFNTGDEQVSPGHIEAVAPLVLKNVRRCENVFLTNLLMDDDGVLIIDFHNLPDEVDVITNPTLRIHNAHPQSQILGDPNTPVQTRSSLKKITEAHALVSYIQAHQRSNHKDQQHCLFACFLSQFEPRKVTEALEDMEAGEAMAEELMQVQASTSIVWCYKPNGANGEDRS